jgi:hypothetical protein
MRHPSFGLIADILLPEVGCGGSLPSLEQIGVLAEQVVFIFVPFDAAVAAEETMECAEVAGDGVEFGENGRNGAAVLVGEGVQEDSHFGKREGGRTDVAALFHQNNYERASAFKT